MPRFELTRKILEPPGVVAVAAGLLWIPYGVLELLEPLGTVTAYDAQAGYDVVLQRDLFALYSLPGALALLLSSVAVLALIRPGHRAPVARGLAWLSLGLGALSLVGVAVAFDPLFTGPRIFGTLFLGLAACLSARWATGRGLSAGLLVVGAVGIALLPMWPAIYAVELASPVAGAALIALFGAGWVGVGWRSSRGRPLRSAA